MKHDIVIPMLAPTWCTRGVIEGLFSHYAPRRVNVIMPAKAEPALTASMEREAWRVGEVVVHQEETFFASLGLSKDSLAEQIDLTNSLYSPGWFYQQLLKLGAWIGIEDLSEEYLVWDADLLPVETWPVVDGAGRTLYALLQHNSKGNPEIVGRWERWIREVLNIEPIRDSESTFVPHHMWFSRGILEPMMRRIIEYYKSDEPWPTLMMQSANDFGTFSEYWLYASWVAATTEGGPRYYSYDKYGSTTERFFDNGTGPFTSAMNKHLNRQTSQAPSYTEIVQFIEDVYEDTPLPSSIAFEQNPRHIKKDTANMHLEEVRSRWHAETLRSLGD